MFEENKGKSGVYRWTNNINHKSYIGSAKNLNKRLYVYYNIKLLSASKMTICRALLKYGFSNFTLEILEYCEPSDAIKREQFYLELLKPEYNILLTAGSLLGFNHSESSIKKMSDAKQGKNNPLFGKTHSK